MVNKQIKHFSSYYRCEGKWGIAQGGGDSLIAPACEWLYIINGKLCSETLRVEGTVGFLVLKVTLEERLEDDENAELLWLTEDELIAHRWDGRIRSLPGYIRHKWKKLNVPVNSPNCVPQSEEADQNSQNAPVIYKLFCADGQNPADYQLGGESLLPGVLSHIYTMFGRLWVQNGDEPEESENGEPIYYYSPVEIAEGFKLHLANDSIECTDTYEQDEMEKWDGRELC